MRVIFFLLLTLTPPAPARAQMPSPAPEVLRVLGQMSAEQRVGQLFLVSFQGTDLAPDSPFYELVTSYHVGGVTLLAANDNFAAESSDPKVIRQWTDDMQRVLWNEYAAASEPRVYVPLWVAISQDGNGYPSDQILNGLTPQPSLMALGATWNLELAQQMGAVQGYELAALGFNLFFGPSLDVLDDPAAASGGLDARVFGGDPFWVGEMGRAYISGLHSGSRNRLFVAAKHFPGMGGSDRLPEEEIPTVRKSIEQLKQIELAPFFAVTGNAPSVAQQADGLLVSHIRYQGFQGNIRATTRPISFDAQALNELMALPQFNGWQAQGGLLISDDLGTRAVREFYTSGGGQFSARNAARDAFLAGNDLLYLGNITSGEGEDTYKNTVQIIQFFNQKYREDPAFARRVDASVARILAAKLRLYGEFHLTNTLSASLPLDRIGAASEVTFEVARNAATLVSPDEQSLADLIPLPPQENERVVFLSDSNLARQCSACPEQADIEIDALRQAVLRVYAQKAGLASYALQDLQSLLDGQATNALEFDLTRANWVVISLNGVGRGQAALVTRFLSERPNLLREKKIVLFSFGAPYYFDTTALSKLTAYYALYSKQPPFVDVAARLLLQELTPPGASPVSIPASGYSLISATAPDAAQVIALMLDLPPMPVTTEEAATPQPTSIPYFSIGDTIAVRTGEIHDRNGHLVPDGTVARFSMLLTGEGGGIVKQVEAVTTQGVARAAFGLDKPGLLDITVASEPALLSETLQLDVSQSGGAVVTVIVPELTEEATPLPAVLQPTLQDPYISAQGSPLFSAWFLAMLLILVSAWVVYTLAARARGARPARRWSLGLVLGGLAAYNLLVFGWLNLDTWLLLRGLSGGLAFVFIGELIGLTAGILWSQQRRTS